METYAVIAAEDLDGLDFSKFRQWEQGVGDPKLSVDETMALVSWWGGVEDMPSGLSPISTHRAEEIGEVLGGVAWTPVIDE